MPAQHLLIATRNAHKTDEIRQMLGAGFIVEDLNARSHWPEIEETADTFLGNASLKAVGISAMYDGLVLSDDSGLEVDALNGAPGVRSARYSGENATDASNRALLLERLAGVRGKARTARFRCVIVLAKAGEVLAHFGGAVEGIIINEEKGEHGFGYDSLFVPEGHCETFAQLPSETKNQLSHRARAMEKVIQHLASRDAS
ncbi:MAG TPA: RdgB/HAM1 family non-canonical purine NTP pyrophosphatase [Chthoniobacterales bacterium]|jgi:XTP/dITP diphosphohydrolase